MGDLAASARVWESIIAENPEGSEDGVPEGPSQAVGEEEALWRQRPCYSDPRAYVSLPRLFSPQLFSSGKRLVARPPRLCGVSCDWCDVEESLPIPDQLPGCRSRGPLLGRTSWAWCVDLWTDSIKLLGHSHSNESMHQTKALSCLGDNLLLVIIYIAIAAGGFHVAEPQ